MDALGVVRGRKEGECASQGHSAPQGSMLALGRVCDECKVQESLVCRVTESPIPEVEIMMLKRNRIWDAKRFAGYDSGCIHGCFMATCAEFGYQCGRGH